MATTVEQLDTEVAVWRTNLYADSTKVTYRSQMQTYLAFCDSIRCPAVPADSSTVCRYIAFLARNKSYTTKNQYLSVIRILHLELGRTNPIADDWNISSLLKSIKR